MRNFAASKQEVMDPDRFFSSSSVSEADAKGAAFGEAEAVSVSVSTPATEDRDVGRGSILRLTKTQGSLKAKVQRFRDAAFSASSHSSLLELRWARDQLLLEVIHESSSTQLPLEVIHESSSTHGDENLAALKDAIYNDYMGRKLHPTSSDMCAHSTHVGILTALS